MYLTKLKSFLVLIASLQVALTSCHACGIGRALGTSRHAARPTKSELPATIGGSPLARRLAAEDSAETEHQPAKSEQRAADAAAAVERVYQSAHKLSRRRRFSNETTAITGRVGGELARTVRIQVTAIHVAKSEFPLSKLLFRLTLKLALGEANKFLEQQQQRSLQQSGASNKSSSSSSGSSTSGNGDGNRRARLKVKLALSVRSANTCSRQYASALAAEEYYVRRARLFIVSGCDDAIQSVSRLASDWRVPIMTAAGFGAELNDKRVHRTLVRVAFSLRAAVEFLFKIMKSHQWLRANLVVDESDPNSLALRGSIEKHMSSELSAMGQREQQQQQQQRRNQSGGHANFSLSLNTIVLDLQTLLGQPGSIGGGGGGGPQNVSLPGSTRMPGANGLASDDRWPSAMADEAIRDTLWQCSLFSRVTILLVPQQHLRKLMLSAYDRNMANGMYTFLSMPLLAAAAAGASADGEQAGAGAGATPSDSAFMWRSAQPGARNAHAKQAFESLMLIYLRTPTTKAYVYFASNLNNLANKARSQKAARHGSGMNGNIQLSINPYSASFYDSLLIYARALNESLGRARRDGRPREEDEPPPGVEARGLLHAQISDLLRNRRFENMVTGTVFINANGDRETDYTLDDMNHMTGKFAPVILYRGETRDIERLGRIHWSSDPSVGPTSDFVDCSLLGTCASKPMTRFTLLLMLLAAPLVCLVSGLFYFVHSRLSLESQLVDYWWKIHLSELEILATRRKNLNDGSLVTTNSLMSSSVTGGPTTSGRGRIRANAISGVGGGGGAGGAQSEANGGGGGPGENCDRTEVTRATTVDTNTSGGAWATSAADVCYGNITLAIFKLAKVALRPISKFHQSRKLMIELRNIKDLSHANLCRFKGILVDEGNLALVSEFCPKGSLREFFQNESMIIDWTFKYSIINDIMAGLLFLNSSAVGFHGRLKSSNCLVSGRFVVKLADYGPHSLFDQLDEQEEAQDKSAWLRKRIMLAPEHMKPTGGGGGGGSGGSSSSSGSMKGDVYSFGLLLYEITTNCQPFFDLEKNDYIMPLQNLYQELRSRGPNEELGPDMSLVDELIECTHKGAAPATTTTGAAAAAAAGSTGATATCGAPGQGACQVAGPQSGPTINLQPLVELMKSCWQMEASKRPSLAEVNASLKRITRGVTSKKLLENLTSRMEQYTNNLESLVEAKLATLLEEKLKTEELLYQFVPKSIASLLKEGQFVEPEAFECVTVFYSDIVGFTSLSSESSPMEVVGFLSDLYLCFDETLEQHDIFKVDTIGDAYIVASGLPLRNEGKHVLEIARAALELRERLQSFRIPHKPDRSLEMRVGIHSGPCVAGIVGGLNMPKYCVFGDTLTVGKFMESSGLPMKIHITEESRALLASSRDYHIEPRVPKITKDGLPFQTYWLEKGDEGSL